MKHILLFLLSFLSSTPTMAADSLGRLFFTPEQRAQLETARAQRDRRQPVVLEAAPPPVATATAPQPRGPEVVTFSGMVSRSDGKSTVWVNGKPITERNRLQNDGELAITGVRKDGTVSVAVPQASRRASLKVGQSLDVESGVIEESYARRVTGIRSTHPAPEPAPTAETPVKPAAPARRPPQSTEAALAEQAEQAIRALRRLRDNPTSADEPAAK